MDKDKVKVKDEIGKGAYGVVHKATIKNVK